MERYFWEFGRSACLIHDRLLGSWSDNRERYIGTARDADTAQRMVDLLNAAEVPKPQAKPRSRARAPIDDIFA